MQHSSYCKTPVVCFSDTSIAEIVNHKINGYVVQNFDSNQLKDGIEWLSREIDNNNLNVESVKNRIEEFASDKIAKKYIKLYEKILNEN